MFLLKWIALYGLYRLARHFTKQGFEKPNTWTRVKSYLIGVVFCLALAYWLHIPMVENENADDDESSWIYDPTKPMNTKRMLETFFIVLPFVLIGTRDGLNAWKNNKEL
jgi:hypothetical protein